MIKVLRLMGKLARCEWGSRRGKMVVIWKGAGPHCAEQSEHKDAVCLT